MTFNVLKFVADNAGLDIFKALTKAYEQGKADAAPKWIPVSKGLPDDDTIVLVTFANGKVGESSWHKTNTYNNGFDAIMHGITKDDKLINFGVVAWKPLPEPYEEGLNELKNPPQAPAIPLARIGSYIKAYKLLELIANALPFGVIETMVEILEQENPGGKKGGDNGKT